MNIANIISSIIAIVAIATLCWQFYSNKRQKFENHFFELLKIHRQNVDEMKIGLLESRNVFKELFYELCNCQIMVDNTFFDLKNKYCRNDENIEQHEFYYNYSRENKINVAYTLFFRGIEFNHIFKVIFPNETILQSEKNTIQEKLKEKFLPQYDKWQQGNFSIAEIKKDENGNQLSFYKPYCGHSEWLGHYYRHLFQTVKFIDDARFVRKKRKYEYIKTLKAQLSEFEQAILFYHACSDLGSVWFENGKDSFIVKYRLIQNLPLLMVYNDECQDLRNKLSQILSEKEIEKYFEIEQ